MQASPDTLRVEGVVLAPDGTPVEGADVFLLPTLEGEATDATGRFAVATTRRDPVTIVVRAAGLATVRRRVVAPRAGLVLRTERRPVDAGDLSVTVSSEHPLSRPDAAMTSLDVVRTPGASADPFRALRTQAGVLAADEGVGVHVQGGSSAETRVLLDGSTMVAPYRTSSASGAAFGSVDPFLLEEISLSRAGFDARAGDALSGVLRAETPGPPAESGASVTAQAAGVSARTDLALGERVGVRMAGGFSDLGPLFSAHGREGEFVDAPRGSETSLSAAWAPAEGTGLKLFAVGRRDRFVSREEGRGADRFAWDSDDHHAVLSGRGVLGPMALAGSLAASGADRTRTFGAFRLHEREELLQARMDAAWALSPGLALRAGAVLERRSADIEGRLSATDVAGAEPPRDAAPRADPVPGDASGASGAAGTGPGFDAGVDGVRRGGFVQAEWEADDVMGFRAGLRLDRSTLSESTTRDPRLAALLWPGSDLEVELAWGRYHQTPDPAALVPVTGVPDAGPMEAAHWTAGLRAREPGPLDRLELTVYRKEYGGLVQEDRTRRHVGGGEGTATGLDLAVSAAAPGDVRLELAGSVVGARRTDPDTGRPAPSPFEASPSVALQARRSWPWGLEVGLAYRYGGGRPFTPVTGARFDEARGAWIPVLGPPRSRRLPALRRLDLSASWLHRFWEDDLTTLFFSVTNVLDRENAADVRWDRDYSRRILVRSSFHRTVFLGASTTFPF